MFLVHCRRLKSRSAPQAGTPCSLGHNCSSCSCQEEHLVVSLLQSYLQQRRDTSGCPCSQVGHAVAATTCSTIQAMIIVEVAHFSHVRYDMHSFQSCIQWQRPLLLLQNKSTTSCRFVSVRCDVIAGDDPDASTDARVYLDLYGTQSQLLDLYLRDSGDNFNR